jgi:hypothetical protein
MADVFISYANEDREQAGRLAGALESCGWSVWWDRKIIAGQAFDEAIELELETAKCVVVLWSRNSIVSEWVKNEAAVAAEREVLVPAQIDRVKLPLEFRRRQTVDLVGWDGNAAHEGFQTLCTGVAAKVTPSQGAAPARPHALPASEPRRKLPWVWVVAAVMAVALGLGLYRGLTAGDRKPPVIATDRSVDLAGLAAGVYYGNVVSDAKGSSRSDVTVTVTQVSPRKVRITSDYPRLGSVELELDRVSNTIQGVGASALFLLELEKNPPQLNYNPNGEVAYVGQRR